MENFITLSVSLAIVYKFAPTIKKYAATFYGFALMLSVLALSYPAFPISHLINGGYIGLSLWIIVMFVGIPNPLKVISKKIRLVRTELSITAFIFTFAHFIHDFIISFELPIATGILSLIIMVPLFATSFRVMRKRIGGASWKRLHHLAYPAYVLMLIHVILVTNSAANLVYYSLALLGYLFFKFKRVRPAKRILKYALLLLMIVNLVASPLVNPLVSEKAIALVDQSFADSSDISYRDGTYTGIADGYGPDLTVEVTVKDNIISIIDILCHNEHDSSYYMPAMNMVPAEIIESQSISVDAVSGSTYTSYGIMNAVGDALSEAIESGSLAEIETPEISEKGTGKGQHRGNK
jgi:uncharacterized protein with FMN-binding domain